MKIWIDADACPKAVKDIVINASVKRKINCVFVANQVFEIPESELFTFQLVAKLPDAADHFIAKFAESGDLAITGDIPLAHELVGKKILVIDHRGSVLTAENINERLSIRDLMSDLRESGEVKGGPKPFGEKEKRLFASSFDRELTKLLKSAR